jgi:exonuclease III
MDRHYPPSILMVLAMSTGDTGFTGTMNKLFNNTVLRSSLANYSSSQLWFCFLNICSLVSKFDEFKETFRNVPFHIIAVTETWLTDSSYDTSFSLEGYNLIRRDRKRWDRERGGGVLIYIENNIKFKILQQSPDQSEIEYIFIEIINKNDEKMVFSIVYSPPRASLTPIILPILTELAEEHSKLLICGDFNVDLLTKSKRTENFIDSLSSLGLLNINNQATNFVNESRTLIDLAITNSINSVIMSSQVTGLSTHDIIYGIFDFTVSLTYECKTKTFRRMNAIDRFELMEKACSLEFDSILYNANIDEMLTVFNNNVLKLLDEFAPEVTVRNLNRADTFEFSH